MEVGKILNITQSTINRVKKYILCEKIRVTTNELIILIDNLFAVNVLHYLKKK